MSPKNKNRKKIFWKSYLNLASKELGEAVDTLDTSFDNVFFWLKNDKRKFNMGKNSEENIRDLIRGVRDLIRTL